ncbi:rust resistance kinase Lr10-like isoform X1 [Malania oleifera]|uniref:rust resistance kinase Lr10-like isoform X1 n=1 Tax=Malania oleifera TaxID=397392 RepID=UPI0025AE5382|nr:rust resistance kinase Lr10-like isoform X1 [Malania oleifera]
MLQRRRLFASFSWGFLLLLPVIFLPVAKSKSRGNHPQYCDPSSCGKIRNISYPFRLKGDPPHCGDQRYELSCDEKSNRTVLHFHSGEFYVEEIHYGNYSMRVVDPGIRRNDCSSLPLYSLATYNFSEGDIYSMMYNPHHFYSHHYNNGPSTPPNAAITFMECAAPVGNFAGKLVASAAPCGRDVVGNRRYSYSAYGVFRLADVGESCTITRETLVWGNGLAEDDNVSFWGIRDAMAYGFVLFWFRSQEKCEECESNYGHCFLNGADLADIACGERCFSSPLLVHNHCFWLNWFSLLLEVMTSLVIGQMALKILCGMPCVLLFFIYKFRRRHLSMYKNIEDFLQSQNNFSPIRYSYSEVKKMTNKFKEKLGEGGYGSVYKGKLRSGCHVAVKMLGKSKANGQEFISEVATIGRIHHVNVVRLIGFCVEGSKRALVYDFMPKGSLEKHIFFQGENVNIYHDKMYEISLGVARGIEYLHQGCHMQILHFDIKPHNILLDENLTPKVSDFGLAKLYPGDDSIVSLTAARGTMGYMAPELFYKNIGGVSYKADVYSFGTLLMEMASKRKNLNPSIKNLSQIYFPSWVYDQFNEGKNIEIRDATEEERKIIKKMIIVALWCIQMRPADRPSMHQVVEMLEGTVEALQMPPKPFMYPHEMQNEDKGADMNQTNLQMSSSDPMDSISLDIIENDASED